MKTCRKCKKDKILEEFSRHKRSKDRRDYYCKMCKKSMKADWELNNPEKAKESSRRSDANWYENNKQKKKDTNARWKKENSEYNRQWYRDYKREREKKDPQFKIQNKIRTRLWYALKNKQKNGSAIKDLGCTIPEFIKYLESQFLPGMTWDNYGEWHIDHIKPLSKFDLENRDEFILACNYKNMQPLWAVDNIKKSNTE